MARLILSGYTGGHPEKRGRVESNAVNGEPDCYGHGHSAEFLCIVSERGEFSHRAM